MPSLTAIILAAGQGLRARTETPKALVKLAGIPVVEHSVRTFQSHVERIIVMHPPGMRTQFESALGHLGVVLLDGGPTRNASSRIALDHVRTSHVLIHDAARPLVTAATIRRVIDQLARGSLAVNTVVDSTDTLVSHIDGYVTKFPNRGEVHRGQTPQGFRTAAIRAAYFEVEDEYTDDCQVLDAAGFQVAVVQGDETNIKITHPGDFAIADRLLQTRRNQAPPSSPHVGRVVVVGGTSGIGEAVADLTGGIRLGTRTGFDATNPDPGVFEDADAVVITAGVLHAGPLAEQTDHDIGEMVAINLGGVIRTARAAAPHLAKTNGHLVLCASSCYSRGRANLAVYSATKAAVVALTQGLAEELPEIRVNCVCPERTDTPLRRRAFDDPPGSLMSPEEAAEQIVAMLGTDLTGQVFDIRRPYLSA